MARNVYIVSYDVSCPKRLRRVNETLKGYGTALHYSVFRCDLTRSELFHMVGDVLEETNLKEDRFFVADLGPANGMGSKRIRFYGRDTQEEQDDGPAWVF